MPRKIGLIGVGGMGLAMARNLIAAGHAVTGYRRGAMDDLIVAGGTIAASPRDLVAAADAVVLSLPSEAAVAEVLERPDGLLAALHPGQVVIETTSLTPAQKRAHAGRIAEAGGIMLDCPVSGTPQM
ncbi:MAG: NAD(P)-binding domain-containing protein, partial [Rhodospirillaceae bacterium]